MRLKKIPKGTKIICFQNNGDKDCIISWNKKPFLIIKSGYNIMIEARSFYVGLPLEEFEEIQLYANRKIEVAFD
jgi:hypothetical protein